MAYGPDVLEEREVTDVQTLRPLLDTHAVTWVDVDGLGDVRAIEALGKVFGLHPLALEDAVNLYQRPKIEEYPEHLFIVVRMVSLVERIRTEQLGIFLGPNFVVTVQGEHPGDCLDPIRKRLRQTQGRIRTLGPDYLTYALLDAVVDHFFPITDEFGVGLEKLEDELIDSQVKNARQCIQAVKQDLVQLRRAVVPMREVVNSMARDDFPLIRPETRVFLRDCFDHTVQLMDVVTTYREIAGGLMELYLSGVSNRMNEIMKVLTLVSTIFIPLTFIVGVYGMNFDPTRSPWNMPEIEWRYGYPTIMGLMAVVAVLLVVYFRRKGWLDPTR
jgi:magnesium transporter